MVVVILHVQEDVMAIVEVPAVVHVVETAREVVDHVTQDATVLVRQAVIKDAQEVVDRDAQVDVIAHAQALVTLAVILLAIQVAQDHVVVDVKALVKEHVKDNVIQIVADVQELVMVVRQILVVRAVKVDVRQLVIQVVQQIVQVGVTQIVQVIVVMGVKDHVKIHVQVPA